MTSPRSFQVLAVAEHGIVQQEREGDQRPVNIRIRGGVPVVLPKDQGKVVAVDPADARIFEDDGSRARRSSAKRLDFGCWILDVGEFVIVP
jgi:hypothetical protein